VFHCLHNFCVTDLSSFYLDVIKDRLYSSAPRSRARRSAQTVLHLILLSLLRDMAPILSFTAEEVFQSMPSALRPEQKTVFALAEPDLSSFSLAGEERGAWETLLKIRGEATKLIEPLRKSGEIGHSLDTALGLYAGPELLRSLQSLRADLRAVFIVSRFELAPLEKAVPEAVQAEETADLRIAVSRARGTKCARCWVYSEEIGRDAAHGDVCPRCSAVLSRTDPDSRL
jgi:isoleucyl-tRNA synthetase